LAIAQRTNAQYTRVYYRYMAPTKATRDMVRKARCARTRRAYAAAVRAMCKRAIERACAQLEGKSDTPPEALDDALDEIRAHLAALDRLEADEAAWAEERASGAGKDVPGPARGSRRASKKQGLLHWGEDTAQRLWDAGKAHPRFADVVALLLLVGVRPTEFERGIRVSHAVDDDGVKLTVTVKGGKCKPDALTPPLRNGGRAKVATGQQQRSLTFRPESPWAMHLVSRLEDMGGADLEITAQAKSVSDMFRRVARAAFKDRKGRLPSAYDCRHDCAAEWKTDQDAEGVAKALGHSSVATQQCYGNVRRKGRRPDRLLAVTASAQPRASAKVRLKPAAVIARLRQPPAAAAARAAVPSTARPAAPRPDPRP
jgi:integrase